MRSPPTPSPSITYDDIYDPACDLVEATARMRRAAATLQDAQLVPSLLNCTEAALHDLPWTAAALEATTVRSTTEHRRGPADPRGPVLVERMQPGWANLQKNLMDAERAAARRARLSRALWPRTPSEVAQRPTADRLHVREMPTAQSESPSVHPELTAPPGGRLIACIDGGPRGSAAARLGASLAAG